MTPQDSPASTFNRLPYQPNSPEGLVARWVQWAASMGPMRHPISDTTGKHAGRKQPADVFFLAGTFGGAATRACSVPSGLPVMFPLINMWRAGHHGMPLLDRAAGEAQLNGQLQEAVAIGTPFPFEISGAFGNPVTQTRSATMMICWGLWGRLEALPLGSHDLKFSGTDGYGFHVGASYRLTVV